MRPLHSQLTEATYRKSVLMVSRIRWLRIIELPYVSDDDILPFPSPKPDHDYFLLHRRGRNSPYASDYVLKSIQSTVPNSQLTLSHACNTRSGSILRGELCKTVVSPSHDNIAYLSVLLSYDYQQLLSSQIFNSNWQFWNYMYIHVEYSCILLYNSVSNIALRTVVLNKYSSSRRIFVYGLKRSHYAWTQFPLSFLNYQTSLSTAQILKVEVGREMQYTYLVFR